MINRLKMTRRDMLWTGGGASVGMAASAALAQEGSARCGATTAGSAFAPALAEFLHRGGLDARDFGARFDGSTDDSAALQRAINAAHEQRRALCLPAGVAILGSPLDLLGRDVSIIGEGMTATVLRAGRPLSALINAEETVDRIVSPFALMRLTLDGARVAERNLAVRFRHHYLLSEVNSIACDTGFWERDCWLSRHFGCRSGDNRVGWHLVGSNHASLFEACTMTACDDVHVLIGINGSAPDGNSALTFRNCDVEFGEGHGIDASFATNALFEGCYLGENIGGDVLRNAGFVLMRGGVLFFGGGTGVGVRPLGGVTNLEYVSINAQAGGIANLVNLAPEEAIAKHGKVSIAGANANLPVGGDPVLQGDVLDRVPMRLFAPRLGRDWTAWSVNSELTDERSPVGLPDGCEVRCIGVSSTTPGEPAEFGLRARLTDERWREAEPVYLACVYRSTAPFVLRLRTADNRSVQFMVNVPASPDVATYVNVALQAPAGPFHVIEAAMPASPGARLGLKELTLADGSNIRTPAGNLKTLALAQ